jgi:hypothetical protein
VAGARQELEPAAAGSAGKFEERHDLMTPQSGHLVIWKSRHLKPRIDQMTSDQMTRSTFCGV